MWEWGLNYKKNEKKIHVFPFISIVRPLPEKKRLKIVELIDMKIVFDCVYLRYEKYERGLFCMKNEEKYMTLLLNVFDLKTILENEWDWLINVVICYYMWKRVWWCENNMFLKKKMNPLLL
jgi:hypothetical protein